MAIKNVDEFFIHMAKRQKYMLFRFFLVFLLVIGLNSIYKTADIPAFIILNSLFLFYSPLCLEYILGMDTYSQYTNTIRWIGLAITSLAIAFCIFGYMGELDVKLNQQTSYLEELIFFGNIHIDVAIIKYYSYSTIIIAVFDFFFSLHRRDTHFYKVQDKLERFIQENMTDFEQQVSPDARKEMYKKEYLNAVKKFES